MRQMTAFRTTSSRLLFQNRVNELLDNMEKEQNPRKRYKPTNVD